MSDKKPNVFPTGGEGEKKPTPPQSIPQQPTPVETGETNPFAPRPALLDESTAVIGNPHVSKGEMAAAQEMLRRTQVQLAERAKTMEEKAMATEQKLPVQALPGYAEMLQDPMKPISTLSNEAPEAIDEKKKFAELCEPKWDAPFDLIPLPSKGKVYNGVRESVKMSYMSGSDENILTSANLLESGEFLRVLISRNLLERNLKYDDLTLGDRNALMLWLRGSSFGNMYPMTVVKSDKTSEEVDFDLNELKYIYLEEDPDENGYFDFSCPYGGNQLKYRFLTVMDEELIDTKIEADEEAGETLNKKSTYTLQQQIVSVDGDTNPIVVSRFIDNMRLGDIKAFRKHYNERESGVDLNIEVRTAGGESVRTFLPFNYNFFWAN